MSEIVFFVGGGGCEYVIVCVLVFDCDLYVCVSN